MLSVSRISVASYFVFFSELFHPLCLARLPSNSNSLAELEALVCGQNFSTLEASYLFIASGLIHLFVVSGAHLIFIKKMLSPIDAILPHRFFNLFLYTVLFIFIAACQFNAPIVRSFLFLILSAFLKTKKIHWPLNYLVFISGMLTLVFNHQWVSSMSLQLSWLITISFLLQNIFFKYAFVLWKHLLSFVFIFPTLLYLQVPQFLLVLTNLILTPFLEFILFPLSLIVWFIPPLYVLFDLLINGLKFVLLKSELTYQFQLSATPTWFSLFNWGLIMSLHLMIHLFEVKQKRKSIFA